MAYSPKRGRWAGREFASRWEYRQARAKSLGFQNENQLARVTRTGDYKAAVALRKESGKKADERWRYGILRQAGKAAKAARTAPKEGPRPTGAGDFGMDFDWLDYIDEDFDDDRDWYE